MKDLDRIIRNLKAMLKLARIVASSDDDKNFPIQQIEYLGKNCDGTMWFPYGMHANLPPDVLTIVLTLNGNSEERYILPSSPKERLESPLPSPLLEGELLLFNPVTKAFVFFKQDGSMIINTPKDLIATVAGDADIIAVNIKLTGVTDINGTIIDLTGKITGGADIISSTGKSLSLHTHAQGADSGGDTEVETNVPT